MKTVAIVAQKGGASKTTTSCHLAVQAAATGMTSLLIDTDPQGSASQWAQWRDESNAKYEITVVDCAVYRKLADYLANARNHGVQFTVIDTPPHAEAMARAAVEGADLVLIPTRVSAVDMAAVQLTVDLVKARGKDAVIVWVAGPSARATRVYAEAQTFANVLGIEAAPARMAQRSIYASALGQGLTAQELEPDSAAAAEVAELWAWVRQRVGL